MKILNIIPGLPTKFDPNRMIWLKDYINSLAPYHKMDVFILESLIHYFKPMYFKKWLSSPGFPEFTPEHENVRYFPLQYLGMPGYHLHEAVTFPNIVRKAQELLKKEDFSDVDVIHAQFCSPAGTLAMHLSEILRKPYIISVLESNFDYIMKRGVKVQEVMEKANFVISITSYLEDWVLKYIDIPPEKRTIIPMGTDFNRFNLRKEKKTLLENPKLLFVAGLVPHKGCHILLEAIKKLKDTDITCDLDVIGVGSEYDRLKTMTVELNIKEQVIFHGRLKEHSDLEKFYHECDVFVLPSFTEGQGVVIVEAMACGKPVVAARCGGAETIIQDNSNLGELVPTGNPEALASGIRKVIENLNTFNPEEIREYAERKYSLESVAGAINEIYEKVGNG